MKKITLFAILILLALPGFSQTTVLSDFEPAGTLPDAQFGFGMTSSVETVMNPGMDAVNSTANCLQYTANTDQDMNAFIGFGLNKNINVTENGNFFQMLVRSDVNNVPIQFQIQDGADPATHNPYGDTKTYTGNGAWQLLEFEPVNLGLDFSVNPPIDRGPNTTGMFGRIIVIVNGGVVSPAGEVYFFDEFSHNNSSILSTNEFSNENGVSYFVRDNQLTINGAISGKELSVFDMSARTMLVAPIKGDINTFDISGLSSGVYVAVTDAGSFKFAK